MRIYKHLNDEFSTLVDDEFPNGTIDIEGDYDNGILLLIEFTDDIKTLNEEIKNYQIEGIGILHPMRNRDEGIEHGDLSDRFYISWDSYYNDTLHMNKSWNECCNAVAHYIHGMFCLDGYFDIDWC